MITVAVYINGKAIFARSARNIGQDWSSPELSRYHTDAGEVILHKRSDGALKLAIALLETVSEP